MTIELNDEEAKLVIASLLFTSSVNVMHAIPREDDSEKYETESFHLARELHKKAGFPSLSEHINLIGTGNHFEEHHYRELFDYFSEFTPVMEVGDV
jgi:hypothetical protein